MVRFYSYWMAICALTLLQGAAAQDLSGSKLSAHLINDYTVGSSNIVYGRPRVLKVLGLDSGWPSGMIAAMRDYKLKAPTGKVVVRIYSPREFTMAEDATIAAGDFWTNILAKSLNHLAPSDRALIDYLEGPNEGQTPTLGYPSYAALEASQWFNQFWTNLTPRIVAAGYKPCIGSIAVGNPGGDMPAHLSAFVPALRQAKAAGGAWSYHSYTIQYTTDVGLEYWYSLRYRQFYQFFAANYPDLTTMPLILTEGGVDESGNPNTSGWRARGSAADYQHWLEWFDQQLKQDDYVMGCTLFQNGDPAGWWSFELEPIADWLRDYLLSPLPDVVITSVGWSPSVISNGNRVVFSARVLNQGTGPTPAGTILGVGFNVDGAGTASWSGSHTAPLAANSSITLTADGGPTGNYWTATPGTHVVVATVDDVNRFPEISEVNNAFSTNFYVHTPNPTITGCYISNSLVHVRWRTVAGVGYALQRSGTLAFDSWVSGPIIVATGTNLAATAEYNHARSFFRVRQID